MTTKKSPRRRPAMAAVLADPRWKMLASGRATPDEIADLRAWAQENETAAEAWEVCRPATEREVNQLTNELLQKLPASSSLELVALIPGDGIISIHALPQNGPVTIGSGEDADIRINALSLSRVHAAIHIGSKIAIEDLGSRNGTKVLPLVPVRMSYARAPTAKRSPQGLVVGKFFRMGWVLATIRNVDASSKRSPTTISTPRLIAQDPFMRRLHEEALFVAEVSSHASIMIVGEAGVGKKTLARMIHDVSSRASNPFVIVDCAALNPNEIEERFFGIARSAVSKTVPARRGLFEEAQGGTIVLDGIDQLPLEYHKELLRVLNHSMFVDVRFIITSANPHNAFAFHRVHSVELNVPPLRARRADIIPLARAFLNEESHTLECAKVPELSPEVIAILEQYEWPGNVRELRHAMTAALIGCREPIMRVEHLPHLKMLKTDRG